MTKGNDTLYFIYDAEGTPVSVKYNGVLYNYVTNLQGDVTAILTWSGQKVVSYTYDAWGKQLSCTGSMSSTLGKLNPLRYRGYVYDQETRLYYLHSRYYNPEWGRFINADGMVATGQSFIGNNMFAYCGNNPVSYSDASGYARNYCVMLTDTGGKLNRLIYRQDASPCTELTYGNHSAVYNSCGVIATYNTLVLKGYSGYENSFPSILEDFEDLGYPFLGGFLGTWHTNIGEYMIRRGVESSRWMGFGNLDTIVEPDGIVIATIVYNNPFDGMHSFACVRTEIGWDVYNRHYINYASKYTSFNDILEDDYLAYALIVY